MAVRPSFRRRRLDKRTEVASAAREYKHSSVDYRRLSS